MMAENAAEREVLAAMRAHAEHGYGEIHIIFSPGQVDIQEGVRKRYKYGLDKKNARG